MHQISAVIALQQGAILSWQAVEDSPWMQALSWQALGVHQCLGMQL